MFVILCYDVGAKRVSKVMKTVKKYLRPVQRSVFDGHISEKNLKALKEELKELIETDNDGIVIYKHGWGGKITTESIGKHRNKESCIL